MRLISAIAALCVAASASAAEFKISPASSKIEFVGSKANGSHTGGFKDFSGTVSAPSSDLSGATIKVEIATPSLYSDNEQLTRHLKTPDFFDVASHPKATFVSTAIAASKKPGTTHDVVGNLTLHGVTKSITVPVKAMMTGDGLTIEGAFTLLREDFKMSYGKGMIKNEVSVKLSMKATK
jgi:polyisoprenoid-binding protein YceI